MSDLNFTDVVSAWQAAPVEAIHPLRSISDEAYWDSGRSQALDASHWVDQGDRVIDFGCGDGRVAIPMAKLGLDVIAVDASEEMLYRLADNAVANGVHIRRVLSDGLDLDLPLVDAVVCRAVLIHHDYDGATRLVLALAKLLKPGGIFIADWPLGPRYERRSWTDVTTWEPAHRLAVADGAKLKLIEDATPSVWRKL